MLTCPFNAGEFNKSLGILICRPTGELTANRAQDLATCRECLEKAHLPQVNRFHDLTGITSVHFKFHDVLCMCQGEAQFRNPDAPVKACYLVPNEVVFGTMNMYAALAESRGVEVHISYNLNELAAVLGVDAAKLKA